MIKFPKIRQFRDALFEMRQSDTLPDRIEYEGTIKLHGTNAGVVINGDNSFYCQSRNRVIEPGDDNLGFAAWFHGLAATDAIFVCREFRSMARDAIGMGESWAEDCQVVVCGEWCGEKIQNGVGINHMPRKWVVFAIGVRYMKGEEEVVEYVDRYIEKGDFAVMHRFGIRFTREFPSFRVTVDRTSPGFAQNYVAKITELVEQYCPVAEALADIPAGGSTIGEGLVWRPLRGTAQDNPALWFKTKGEKHSASKVKTIAAVDPALSTNVTEFVKNTVTDVRCQQGIDYLTEHGLELSKRSTGEFLKWVGGDVLDEEKAVMEASGLERKDVGPHVGRAAREWYFGYLNSLERAQLEGVAA